MVDIAQVGQTNVADGVQAAMRAGRQSDLIVSQLHGRYYENVSRGNVFSLNLTATTTGVAAGNINSASAAASTQFALWNPLTSGVNLSLLFMYNGITSGTLVGGPLFHNTFNILPTIANVGTAVNSLLGAGQGPAAKYVASAAGATLTGGGALSIVRPSTIGYSAGSYVSVAGAVAYEEIMGSLVIKPGAGWVPCFAAAGTTVLNSWGVVWEEVPV